MSDERGPRPPLPPGRPAAASPTNLPTMPWPGAEELLEGVEFVDEAAARRFDLDRAVGEGRRPPGGDVTDAGPWTEFWTWVDAERWVCDQGA